MLRERYHGPWKPISIAALGAVLFVIWRIRPFRIAVEGPSMSPTLLPGDFLVAVRPDRIRRGAVAVIHHPGRPGYEIVKRVAAEPGQTVDGIRLGPDDWWVIGDDPTSSTDSRTFGPVHRSQIAGIARLRYWPPGRVGFVR